MSHDSLRPNRIKPLPADQMPPPIKHSPEEAAKIAEFNKQLGPAFVKALNQQVTRPRESEPGADGPSKP